MSTRRGVPDWLKKLISMAATVAASQVLRECCRRLLNWLDEIFDDTDG